MFGGLEIKGDGKKEKESAPAPAMSGFSFMNSGPPQSNPAPPASSGFSFMGGSAAPEKAAAPTQTSSASSAFSFLQTAPPTGEPPKPSSSSGFGFITPAPPEAPMSSPASSSFSFMASSPSSTRPTESLTDPAPAGAGIVFGGSAATTSKKPIKKRNRGIKVGGGRGEGIMAPGSAPSSGNSLPPPSAMASSSYGPPAIEPHHVVTPPPMEVAPAPVEEPQPVASNVKNDAEEAARRAEAFMQAKLQEQSALGPPPVGETTMMAPTSRYSVEVDDEVEAAKRAAEEAQARLAKQADQKEQKSAFSWFKSSKPWGSMRGDSSDQIGSSSRSASVSNSVHDPVQQQQPSVAVAPPVEGVVSPTNVPPEAETPAERIAREQEEIKRAMAQRHFAMQQDEEKAQDTGTNNMTVVAATNPNNNPNNMTIWSKPKPVELPAPPPPPPSPKEVLEEILDDFDRNAKKALERVMQLRQQRNMLLDERFVALAKERLAVQQISQAESQQTAAADAEDFDLADRLQVVIDGLTREKAELKAILENIGRALVLLDAQTPSVVGAVTSCFQRVELDLKEFQEKQTKVERADDTDAMKRFSTTAKQLSAEDERLKSELKHLERDADQVGEERKELDSAILEHTSDMEQSREEAKAKLDETEKEILVLRETLRAKEAEVTQLRHLIDTTDNDISKILLRFTRQITRVQKKETSLKENRREWENEQQAYNSLKQAHEAEVKAHSEALLQHNELMDTIKKEIELAGSFQPIVSQELSFHDARQKDEEKDEELAQMQADVVKCEAAVNDAKGLLKAAESSLVTLDGERKLIEANIPRLEMEKKRAAAKRDFKAAGKASKEIKEATARLHELESELLNQAKERRQKALRNLEPFQKDLDAKKAVANDKEKESGLVEMKKVAGKIKHLLEVKEKECGEAPDQVRTQSVAAYVIRGQINALKLEGQAYGNKFGGWDEIMASIDANDEQPGMTSGETPETTSERPSNAVDPERVVNARQLTKRLLEAEASLEAAVSKEDYDLAAELDSVFQKLKTDIEALNLTDAETELVMSQEELAEEGEKKEQAPASEDPETEQPVNADAAEAPSSDPTSEEAKAQDDAKPTVTTDQEEEQNDEPVADGESAADDNEEKPEEKDGIGAEDGEQELAEGDSGGTPTAGEEKTDECSEGDDEKNETTEIEAADMASEQNGSSNEHHKEDAAKTNEGGKDETYDV